MITDDVRKLGKVLWDYHNVQADLPPAVDLMLVAGSHDATVAVHAAQLYKRMTFKVIVASGGHGKITSRTQAETEASRFRHIMQQNGVPSDEVLLEEKATNTGENVTLTRAVVADAGFTVESAVIVTKPYMARRAIATAEKQWPIPKWYVSAPEISFREYAPDPDSEMRMLNLMVGDLQRVEIYAKKGFQTPQHIPSQVWNAYEQLVDLGFDKHVIKS